MDTDPKITGLPADNTEFLQYLERRVGIQMESLGELCLHLREAREASQPGARQVSVQDGMQSACFLAAEFSNIESLLETLNDRLEKLVEEEGA